MMPRMDGFELTRQLRDSGSAPPVIVMTGAASIDNAIAAIVDCGAFWYLEKPVNIYALHALIDRAASLKRERVRYESILRQTSYGGVLGELVGNSGKMQEVLFEIQQIASSSASVLLVGESGTGKKSAARAICEHSPRRDALYVVLNCAAMSETLMESELFGHEKGAFVGAIARRRGCFELAQGGTVLLEEIGTMPMATQAKLLRMLESNIARRLGGGEYSVDVRVIASTIEPLDSAMKSGQFREDLYYRLNVFTIALPPLRERKPDLSMLIHVLLGDLNRKHGIRVTEVSPAVKERFEAHDWPGNVRELRNILEGAAIVAGAGTVEMHHLPRSFRFYRTGNAIPTVGDVRIPVGSTMEQAERAVIEMTLFHTQHDQSASAQILGLSPKNLTRKLKEYGSSDQEIELLKLHNEDLKEIVLAISSRPTIGSLEIQNSGTMSVMGDSAPRAETAAGVEMPKLDELISALEQRLSTAPTLTSEDKELVQEKLAEIAKAANRPEDTVLRKAGRSALLALKGLAGSLPDVVKILEAAGKIIDAAGKFKH
jgi:DNA-binding NtrC family response regulator